MKMTEIEKLDEQITILMFMSFCNRKGLFIRDREAALADDVELIHEYQIAKATGKEL